MLTSVKGTVSLFWSISIPSSKRGCLKQKSEMAANVSSEAMLQLMYQMFCEQLQAIKGAGKYNSHHQITKITWPCEAHELTPYIATNRDRHRRAKWYNNEDSRQDGFRRHSGVWRYCEWLHIFLRTANWPCLQSSSLPQASAQIITSSRRMCSCLGTFAFELQYCFSSRTRVQTMGRGQDGRAPKGQLGIARAGLYVDFWALTVRSRWRWLNQDSCNDNSPIQ